MFESHRLTAHNTATQSDNKIHDDEVARRFGFAGGLVPGVDVYAYLTRPAAQAWGSAWLERGTMCARFLKPVYDGREVTVVPLEHTETSVVLEVRNDAGDLCATGEATLPPDGTPSVELDDWPDAAPRSGASSRPDASPEALAPGTAFALERHGFHADRHGDYLAAVRDDLPLYREQRVAHPGWLLRDANYVLSSNVRLGPWIHVESVVQHLDAVRDGDSVGARATVRREWEHKGHRCVELDVVLHAASRGADDRAVARVTHTAIYRPRARDREGQPGSSGSTSR